MRGLTRLEFDCLREAERAHGTPSPLPITDPDKYTPEQYAAFDKLIARGLLILAACPENCGAVAHVQLTAAGRSMLAWARLPETGIIGCYGD